MAALSNIVYVKSLNILANLAAWLKHFRMDRTVQFHQHRTIAISYSCMEG